MHPFHTQYRLRIEPVGCQTWLNMQVMKNTTLSLLRILAMALALCGCTTPPTPSLALANSTRPKSAAQPLINTVEAWGGTRYVPKSSTTERPHKPVQLTLHHGGVPFAEDRNPREYLQNLQTWSRGMKKWIDIPYHYIIDLKGNVYEGRDILYAGDTNTEYDPIGHALVMVVGDYEQIEPNPAQLSAVVNTMVMISKKYNISPATISGHKNHSNQTVCPGKNLAKFLENGYFESEVRKQLAATSP